MPSLFYVGALACETSNAGPKKQAKSRVIELRHARNREITRAWRIDADDLSETGLLMSKQKKRSC
jgi:hypothetical protein